MIRQRLRLGEQRGEGRVVGQALAQAGAEVVVAFRPGGIGGVGCVFVAVAKLGASFPVFRRKG